MNIWLGLFSFLTAVFSGKTGDSISCIMDIAKEIVKDYDSQPLNGRAKKELVFETIQERAIKDGLEFSTHAINLAIELAVAEIRK